MVQRGGFLGVCVSRQGVSLADGPVVASLRSADLVVDVLGHCRQVWS